MRAPTIAASFLAALMTADVAAAQPAGANAPAAAGAVSGWSAMAGYETFELRDISRSTTPPDASPIRWHGEGPAVTARYEREQPRSRHLAEFTMAGYGSFEYVSPTRGFAANAGDTAARLEARYEYRRYFWRDLGLRGLALGGGIQGIATRLTLERHIAPTVQTSTRITGGGFAGVVAADFRRWDRVRFGAAWANGAVASNRRTEHSADPELAVSTSGGGNWLTELSAAVEWQITSGLRLAGVWRTQAAGYSSSHMSFAEQRHAVAAGLVYAR